MKNSFVLYTDYLEQVEDLDDDQCGKLFRAILEYQKNGDVLPMDSVTNMAFKFIKAQLDRDNDKYKETCEKRKESGRKGGLAKQANARSARNNSSKSSKTKQTLANLADNDNEYDNDNDDENEDDNDDENDILSNPSNHTYMDPLAVKLYSAKGDG